MSELAKDTLKPRRLITRGRATGLALIAVVAGGGVGAIAARDSAREAAAACRTSIKRQEASVRHSFLYNRGGVAKFHVLEDPNHPKAKLTLFSLDQGAIGIPVESDPVVLSCGSKAVKYLRVDPEGKKVYLTTLDADRPDLEVDEAAVPDMAVQAHPKVITESLRVPSVEQSRAGFTLADPREVRHPDSLAYTDDYGEAIYDTQGLKPLSQGAS